MDLVSWLRGFALAATGVAAIRLYFLRLHTVYRVFFWYLAFRLLQTVALMPFSVRSGTYMKLWILSEPVYWLFHILLVLEIYSLVLEKYRGIYTLGRKLLLAALVVSVGISGAGLLSAWGDARQSSLLNIFYLIDRGIDSSLLIFLLVILAFLAWYPVPLSRNIKVHCTNYFVFFLLGSLNALTRAILPKQFREPMNDIVAFGSLACLVAWIVFLSPQGEKSVVAVRANSAAESQLLEQLRSFNATLLRAARK